MDDALESGAHRTLTNPAGFITWKCRELAAARSASERPSNVTDVPRRKSEGGAS
jgi:hypothetical protein